MKYIKGLDTIRAVAILLVIFYHYGPKFAPETGASIFVNLLVPDGKFGVTLFFVLSGFLITSILLHAKENELHSKGSIIKNFFVRRTLRIFPIYYLCLFALILIRFPFAPGSIPYNLTYTSNFYIFSTQVWDTYCHTWSLSVEEQFYILWPWLILFIRNNYLKYLFGGFIAIGIVSSIYTHVVLNNHMSVLPFECFDAFGIGGWYAYAMRSEESLQKFRRAIRVLFIPAVITFLTLNVLHLYYDLQRPWVFSRTIESIISIGLIDAALNNKSVRVQKYFLENGVLNFIGRISYGLYLYQYPLLGVTSFMIERGVVPSSGWLYEAFSDPTGAYLIRLGILFLVAYASYRLVELPLLRLKKHFNYGS